MRTSTVGDTIERPARACQACVEDHLKTPVTSIRAAAEILRDHADVTGEERDRFLAAIIEDSRRLEAFAERLVADESTEPAAGAFDRRPAPAHDLRLDRSRA
ncbi:MAG: histidine kinase dimerization/phospho-acceptor domain-containing protein [Rhodospirillales bacterium]